MPTQVKLPDDHPMMVAWRAFQATEDFANSKRWAEVVDLRIETDSLKMRHPHLDGSLWNIFMNGFLAGERSAETQEGKQT